VGWGLEVHTVQVYLLMVGLMAVGFVVVEAVRCKWLRVCMGKGRVHKKELQRGREKYGSERGMGRGERIDPRTYTHHPYGSGERVQRERWKGHDPRARMVGLVRMLRRGRWRRGAQTYTHNPHALPSRSSNNHTPAHAHTHTHCQGVV